MAMEDRVIDEANEDESQDEVKILRLRPGDTIVLTVARPLSQMAIDAIKRGVTAMYPGHNVLVLPDGAQIALTRQEESQDDERERDMREGLEEIVQ